MKINHITPTLRTALLSLTISLGAGSAALLTGCQDDHFDVNTDSMNGTSTLWQNIESRSELSQFADILRNVYYSQDEEKTTEETYANLFNGEQTFTVWAPTNGSFDYTGYKALLNSGVRENIVKVENELIRNSMTRYRQIMNGTDSVKIDLYNKKWAWLNYNNQTLKGVSISTPNVGASNGVLHIANGAVPYQPSLYEYISTRTDLDSLNTFIKSWQTTEFNEAASTQGPTINGQITWVDSITYVQNKYLNMINAKLNSEDSSYVMVLPTNNAWTTTLEKTKKYFHYRSLPYKQTVYTQTEAGNDTIVVTDKTLKPEEIDSLENLYSKNAICQNLTFNANWQYDRAPISTRQDLSMADSLKSTINIKFKKTGTLNGTNKNDVVAEVDNLMSLFGNNEPVEVSNGYAYVVDSWNYPIQSFAYNYDTPASLLYEHCTNVTNSNTPEVSTYSNVYNSVSWYGTFPSPDDPEETIQRVVAQSYNGKVTTYTYDEEGEQSIVAQYDSIYKYDYTYFTHNGNNSPTAYFKMPGLLSCKYDIGVVVGYNLTENKPCNIQAFISYDTDDTYNTRPRVPLTNTDPNAIDAEGNSIYGKNQFVNKGVSLDFNDPKLEVKYTDTLWVARDFEFPVCYFGDDLEGQAYPVLELYNYVKNSQTALYTRDMWINAIIIKSKEW